MTNKVRIKVLLPASQTSYEFRVPLDITVEQGAQLVARILAAREQVRYKASDEVDLAYLDGSHFGELVNPKETFRNLVVSGEVVDGFAFMLA